MPVMFDALTEVDEGGKIVPALATSWRAENELT
jgi:ABC-type transport system substrate-binding protein